MKTELLEILVDFAAYDVLTIETAHALAVVHGSTISRKTFVKLVLFSRCFIASEVGSWRI